MASISSSLTDGGEADLTTAVPLPVTFLAGRGIQIYGEGFILDEKASIIKSLNALELESLRPLINGQSLMSGKSSGRLIIDVGKYANEHDLISEMPTLATHLQQTVKPIRDKITSQIHEARYWAFWDKRERLMADVASLDKFIVLARDTRVPVFTFSNDHQSVFNDNVILMASDSASILGILSSTVHAAWFEQTRTGRGTTSCYVVSRCLRTFPFPLHTGDQLANESDRFINTRDCALKKFASQTQLYNHLDDPAVDDPLVVNLRAAQRDLDAAVCSSYGWDDLHLEHGFFELAGVRRFTCDPRQRSQMRRRLLDENLSRGSEQTSPSRIGRGSGNPRNRDSFAAGEGLF